MQQPLRARQGMRNETDETTVCSHQSAGGAPTRAAGRTAGLLQIQTCQGRAHPLEASPSGGGVMLVMATVCCQPGAACLPREANIPSYIRTYKRTSKRDSPPSCAASPVLTAHEALHRGHSMACVSFARAPYLIPARSSAEKAIFRGLPCLDASSTCRALALRPPRQRSPICL